MSGTSSYRLVQRLTKDRLDWHHMHSSVQERHNLATGDDWEAVQAFCGYGREDFSAADAPLPLCAAEIQHFCRNHRECDVTLAGQFGTVDGALPESLSVLYSIYLTQTRTDAESTLFLAQTSGSTRVARLMADLFALGGFCHGDKSVFCEGRVYAIAAAFDTAGIIDAANQEAAKRLALPADHPDHLLQLSPDDVGLLAAELTAQHRFGAEGFLRKANLLAEARQDVERFAPRERLMMAIREGDLPVESGWGARILAAVRRILPAYADMIDGKQAASGPHQVTA